MADTGSNTNALVKVGGMSLSEVIEKKAWENQQIHEVAIVLFEPTAFQNIPPMTKPSLDLVRVNPDTSKKDCYAIKNSKEVGLHKASILRIAAAAGVEVGRPIKETPDSDIDHYRYSVVVSATMPNGRTRKVHASAEWAWEKKYAANLALAKRKKPADLYGQTPEEWATKRTTEEREYAGERTETRAILRGVREFLALKTAYSPEELRKPFLVGTLVPHFDMNDPMIKEKVIERALDSAGSIFGGGVKALPVAVPATNKPDVPDADFSPEPEEDVTSVDAGDETDEVYPPAPGGGVIDRETGEILPEAPEQQQASGATNPKLTPLAILCNEVFKTEEEMRLWFACEYDVSSRKELTDEQLSEAIDKLTIIKRERGTAGASDFDSQIAQIRQELGEETFTKVLAKLGKASLEEVKPAAKKALLDFARGVKEGRCSL